MFKPNFARMGKLTKTFLMKHSADILTGFTAAGVVVTAIETHKATRKADEFLRINGYDKANPDTKKVLKFEAAKNYIIPVVTGVATIGAAIGANYINHREIAGLAAACTVFETAMNEKDAAIAKLSGEKGLAKVNSEVMKERGKQIMNDENAVIVDCGDGDTYCVEGFSGIVLKTNPERFYRAQNRYNEIINQTTYAAWSEYLEFLYEGVNGPHYIPKKHRLLGHGVHSTGILTYEEPLWEGNATDRPYVVFNPMNEPITNYEEIL